MYASVLRIGKFNVFMLTLLYYVVWKLALINDALGSRVHILFFFAE